jgi:hypothetical protein
VQARVGSSAFRLTLVGLMDGLNTVSFRRGFSFVNSSTWGAGVWGAMLWGGGDPGSLKQRLMRAFFGFSCELSNPYPNQPVSILGFSIGADRLGRRKVASGG